MIILYGSESGTAQEVAERFWREAKMLGLDVQVSALDDYDMSNLLYENVAVFVVSTTGQGDPPSNMKRSWRFLLRKSLPKNSLQNLSVGVLGLGDSSYVRFNFVAKKLYRRLCDGLSARPLCEVGLADEQHDLGQDAVVNPWASRLWEILASDIYKDKLKGKNLQSITSLGSIFRWSVKSIEESPSDFNVTLNSSAVQSYKTKLSFNERTTPEEHFQEVRVLKFEPVEGESKFNYSPGDVAVILPENSEESVNKLMSLLSEDNNRQIKISRDSVLKLEQLHPDLPVPTALNKPITFYSLAKKYWDLNVVPRRYVFEVMAKITQDPLEREKLEEFCTGEGQEELYNYCNRPRRTILEVLADFPHVLESVTLDHLFEIFHPIRPRYFSIASSPVADVDLQIIVAVVRYKTKLVKPRLGLCSTWMCSLPVGTEICLGIKKGSLTFPKEKGVPVVMVGPGTGIAPFRSYVLTEIAESKKEGSPIRDLILLFGCRNMKADFHFEKDLVREEVILRTAFSRDQPHKIYVQHLLDKEPKLFYDAIYLKKGYFYVAGNSKDMPQAVRDALIKCLKVEGNIPEEEGDKFITEMERKGSYQTETWG